MWVRAVFRGDVQGVGFRMTAKAVAEQLKITGYAKNEPDGSVYVEAEGIKASLSEFLHRLEDLFKVQAAEVHFANQGTCFSQFSIF